MGLEDQALTDLIARNELPVRVVTLDTGACSRDLRLDGPHACDVPWVGVRDVLPGSRVVGGLREQPRHVQHFQIGRGPKTCCGIRKIDPLHRALEGAEVWVTGLRSAQSDNRAGLARLERDAMSGKLKYNPLLDWTDGDLDTYVNSHSVPTNPLHRKGYPSIGCAPCTRAVMDGEHPRAGRWWWEQSTKECGLHKG